MKIGQLISLQGEDVLPPEFAQALAVLRARATPMPLHQLRRMLGREYGKGWERRFSNFHYDPLQRLHRAGASREHARCRDLALMVQYPGVARSRHRDVDNVAVIPAVFNLLPLDLTLASRRGCASLRRKRLPERGSLSKPMRNWPTSQRCSFRACIGT
jgi:predicted unusual protein kinase regulating ubiquinone biosynthesis (AarF/ABC1/UbiB family)